MRLKSVLYKILRLSNDVNAMKRGKLGERVGRRVTRKAKRKLFRKLFR